MYVHVFNVSVINYSHCPSSDLMLLPLSDLFSVCNPGGRDRVDLIE